MSDGGVLAFVEFLNAEHKVLWRRWNNFDLRLKEYNEILEVYLLIKSVTEIVELHLFAGSRHQSFISKEIKG
jgi:hypothetical protein